MLLGRDAGPKLKPMSVRQRESVSVRVSKSVSVCESVGVSKSVAVRDSTNESLGARVCFSGAKGGGRMDD